MISLSAQSLSSWTFAILNVQNFKQSCCQKPNTIINELLEFWVRKNLQWCLSNPQFGPLWMSRKLLHWRNFRLLLQAVTGVRTFNVPRYRSAFTAKAGPQQRQDLNKGRREACRGKKSEGRSTKADLAKSAFHADSRYGLRACCQQAQSAIGD